MTYAQLPEGWLSLGRVPLKDGELYAVWADGGARLQGIYQYVRHPSMDAAPPVEDRVAPAPGYRAVDEGERGWTAEPISDGGVQ